MIGGNTHGSSFLQFDRDNRTDRSVIHKTEKNDSGVQLIPMPAGLGMDAEHSRFFPMVFDAFRRLDFAAALACVSRPGNGMRSRHAASIAIKYSGFLAFHKSTLLPYIR